jgi:hypothetical protein
MAKMRSGSTLEPCKPRTLASSLTAGTMAPRVKLLPEWLPRIKPVGDEDRSTLLGAELCLSLTIGPIPEGADPSEFEDIGLHHPSDSD